jgi:hypothetical protein
VADCRRHASGDLAECACKALDARQQFLGFAIARLDVVALVLAECGQSSDNRRRCFSSLTLIAPSSAIALSVCALIEQQKPVRAGSLHSYGEMP